MLDSKKDLELSDEMLENTKGGFSKTEDNIYNFEKYDCFTDGEYKYKFLDAAYNRKPNDTVYVSRVYGNTGSGSVVSRQVSVIAGYTFVGNNIKGY